ncbi:hypothetical protein [Corynebacterium sp. UBA2622]|uniref:hypothetical protein n=1 Tax=Corynebacterium sp. UBA2622 TaxID=1946393 RepID=UPI0025C718E3|nr:hypothetical protein [Corynebacterium sp. UBA2622]
MTPLLVFAALIVLLVAAAVLPRRARHDSAAFPWFWVAFPVAALSTALAIYSLAPRAPLNADFGWGMYMPLADATDEFEGTLLRSKIVWAAASVVSLALSAWAWRRGRV